MYKYTLPFYHELVAVPRVVKELMSWKV